MYYTKYMAERAFAQWEKTPLSLDDHKFWGMRSFSMRKIEVWLKGLKLAPHGTVSKWGYFRSAQPSTQI